MDRVNHRLSDVKQVSGSERQGAFCALGHKLERGFYHEKTNCEDSALEV